MEKEKLAYLLLLVLCLAIGVLMARQFNAFYPEFIPLDFGNVTSAKEISETQRATFGWLTAGISLLGLLMAAVIFFKFFLRRRDDEMKSIIP